MSQPDPPPRSRFTPDPAVLPGPRRPQADGWEIVIADDLNEKSGELIEKLTDVPPRSAGTLWFDSPGGSVYSGLAVASVLKLRGLRATGVVAGECSSAALMPLAACSRRVVTPHCTLLFHPIRWTGEEDMRMEDAAEWARHFADLEKDLDSLLAGLFGCDPSVLQDWTRPGRFVTGREMVDAGLAELVTLYDGDVWRQLPPERGRGRRRT